MAAARLLASAVPPSLPYRQSPDCLTLGLPTINILVFLDLTVRFIADRLVSAMAAPMECRFVLFWGFFVAGGWGLLDQSPGSTSFFWGEGSLE